MKCDHAARIHKEAFSPKLRGIRLGEFLVRETLPKASTRVEVLAVMAKYNPFFEKAGMAKVDYHRDDNALSKKIKVFLEERSFDFNLVKSKAYCYGFFSKLNYNDRKALLDYISRFLQQAFVKVKTATPEQLTRVFSSEGVHLYWINIPL
jgi:hypothetical protein